MVIAEYPFAVVKKSELIQKTASSKGLALKEQPESRCPMIFQSLKVNIFILDCDFVQALKKRGFDYEPSAKPPRDDMIYLSGKSRQTGEVFESDCWAWKKTEISADNQPHFSVSFHLFVWEQNRGVRCQPAIGGNWSGGACHLPTIQKLVRAIAAHFPTTVHPLIHEAAAANFELVIPFASIGLGGIRSVGWLFKERYGNEKIKSLARSRISPFDPYPFPEFANSQKLEEGLFIPEEDQMKLFNQWDKQLQLFKDQLT